MARKPRIVFDFGLYHITVRGNNKQQVFYDTKDFDKYLKLITHYKDKFKFKLYAYVLMLNHLHLLVETSEVANISEIMKPLNHRYALWHNMKYNKKGHLWEERFHSMIIEKESYLLECIRYIELNPVRSHFVTHLKNYKWSSYAYHAYNHPCPILDTHPIFNEFGKNPIEIKKNYRKFMEEGVALENSI
ncbi:MAG: transposase [Candidatus Omnitrophica bacterium]|nr:transposase [Candidatus Omnitrophota bacterium]